MFTLRYKAGIGSLFLIAGMMSTQTTMADVNYPANNGTDDCSKSTIASTSDWFPHSQTPEPDNQNFDSSTICAFNAWSWQMFLWLTQKDNGKPRFLNFDSPYDVLGIESREVLKPYRGHSPFDEIFQAGPGGILVDQNGNIVYYSQYLDDTFVNFIKQNDLTNPEAVQALDPNTSFPIGSVELKASWRIVEDGEDTSDVFTMEHEVYGVKQEGAQFALDPSNIRKVKLALVGFHIGGVVKGHPEMIWATFEHIKNSPVVPEKFDPNTPIATSGDYTFYNTSANTKYADCNKDLKSPFLTLDEATQKMAPATQVCLQYKFGNPAQYNLSSDPSVNASIQKTIDTSHADVTKLNTLVSTRLKEEKNLWANYRQVGSLWFKGENLLKPNMTLATDFNEDGSQLLIGAMMLSNSTIETFTQVASTENNCFRCHNTEQRLLGTVNGYKLEPLKPTNLNISHAFVNIYTWSQLLEKMNK